jgi:hypothetical protein
MKLKINESGDSIWIKEEETHKKANDLEILRRIHGF